MGWDKTFPSALGKSHSLRDTIVCKVMRSVSYTWKSLVSHVHVRENVMCLYQLPGIWLTEIQFTLPTCGTQQLVKILSVIFYTRLCGQTFMHGTKLAFVRKSPGFFQPPCIPFLCFICSGKDGLTLVYLLFCFGQDRRHCSSLKQSRSLENVGDCI